MSTDAPRLPDVKFNKNGYEIRSDILNLAQNFLLQEFHAKYQGWEVTSHKSENGQVITQVSMPEFPGLDQVLQTAEKMYSFVNQGQNSKVK